MGPRERDEGEPRIRRALGGKAGVRRDGDEHRAARAHRLFHQLIAAPRRQQDESGSRVDSSARHRADQLVERVMPPNILAHQLDRSEEHTSELQSLMRISYAVFCLKKQKKQTTCQTSKITRDNVQKQANNNTKTLTNIHK